MSAAFSGIIVLYDVVKNENKKIIARWLIGFVGAMIALQASWPIFIPRISLDDTNLLQGKVYADDRNQYQILQETIIVLKQPLFPVIGGIVGINYRIADNLVVSEEYNSSNLEITDSKSKDRNAIKVIVKHVTGWSFDELTGKITYWKDKSLKVRLPENTNISSLDGALNMTSPEESWVYPDRFDYRHIIDITNNEDFPVEIFNITFTIDKDSEAWKSLKNWTDEGYCSDILVLKEWDNILDKDRSYTYVNDKVSYRINKDTFNSSKISIKVGIIRLPPQEKNKRMDLIFRKRIC